MYTLLVICQSVTRLPDIYSIRFFFLDFVLNMYTLLLRATPFKLPIIEGLKSILARGAYWHCEKCHLLLTLTFRHLATQLTAFSFLLTECISLLVFHSLSVNAISIEAYNSMPNNPG